MDWNPGFGEVDCEGNVDIIGYEQLAGPKRARYIVCECDL